MNVRFPLLQRVRRFRDETRGSISVEAVLVFPLLMWAYTGTFVYFDAFRAQSTNVKAAYTIADTLSRETEYVTPDYVDSLYRLQQFLMNTDQPVQLRLTVFRYDEDADVFRVRWTQSRGGAGGMTDAGLADLRDRLPDVPDGEVGILVQSRVGYVPAFSVGLDNFEMDELMVTRPRFAPTLCWNSRNSGGTASTETC